MDTTYHSNIPIETLSLLDLFLVTVNFFLPLQSKKSFFRIFSCSITGWDPDFVAVSAKLKDFEKLSYVEKLFYVLGNDSLSSNELMEQATLQERSCQSNASWCIRRRLLVIKLHPPLKQYFIAKEAILHSLMKYSFFFVCPKLTYRFAFSSLSTDLSR